MGVLYLQGGGESPRTGPGRRVHEVDWPTGLTAPHLNSNWLAQPFQAQLEEVEGLLEDADGAVGYAWGAWLLLCALERGRNAHLESAPFLFLSSFFNRGRFTGQDPTGYRLPRADRVKSALSRGGKLDDLDLRFVHGLEDQFADPVELSFLKEVGFSVTFVSAGHRLLGAGDKAVQRELVRMRARLSHRRQE